MAIFQFYVKDQMTLHLDINSSTFIEEKYQLIAQGFEREGDIVQAVSSAEAYEKFKTIHLDELQDFTNTHLFVNSVNIISSIG